MGRHVQRWGPILGLLLGLAGCASSHVLVGTARSPIDPSQVKLYLAPPAQYESIALVEASSKHSMSFGDQAKTNKVIERLKAEAAALGANGLLLHGVGVQPTGTVGVGTATATSSRGMAIGSGLGVSGTLFEKSGHALAIFVTQE